MTLSSFHISFPPAAMLACMVIIMWVSCPLKADAAEQEPDSLLNVEVAIPVAGLEAPAEAAADSIDDGTDYFTAAGYSPVAAGERRFNPVPERAVWLSALLPGLGQVYNRRFWKLPIIVAGYMGLGYATSWNNTQLRDYSQAYRDLLDSDPSTNSYMNFFPPTTVEDDLDRQWLENVLKSRKNYYRRNRDLCVIAMVAVYLLCMVDAYVDATMAHFDISPSLSLDVAPAIFPSPGERLPAAGLQWAFTF